MDISAVKTRLARIQRRITGVKRAYEQAPMSLPSTDLPVFVNFTGPATDDFATLGAENDLVTRTFIMRLYVKEIQQGIDGEVERLVEPFLTRVRQAFAARPGLSDPGDPTTDPVQLAGPGLAGVYRSRLLGDSGISVLTYGNGVNDIQYAGIEFRLNVLAAEDVVFAKYE